MFTIRFGLVCVFITVLSACTQFKSADRFDRQSMFANNRVSVGNVTAVPVLKEERQNLENKMDRLIGGAMCSDNSQCKNLAVGHKPCGGPEAFKPFSTLSANEKQLLRLSIDHRQISEEITRREKSVSACMLVPEPEVICKQRRCQVASVDDVLQQRNEFLVSISNEVGSADCLEDSQCDVLAVGETWCDEPRSQIAYAKTRSNERYLHKLANEVTRIENRFLYDLDMSLFSCHFEPRYQGYCINRRCTAL